VDDFYGNFTGYRSRSGIIACNDARLSDIWTVAGHRAPLRRRNLLRLPYYEQMQYVGDTRIQSSSPIVAGDDRLMRTPSNCTISGFPRG